MTSDAPLSQPQAPDPQPSAVLDEHAKTYLIEESKYFREAIGAITNHVRSDQQWGLIAAAAIWGFFLSNRGKGIEGYGILAGVAGVGLAVFFNLRAAQGVKEMLKIANYLRVVEKKMGFPPSLGWETQCLKADSEPRTWRDRGGLFWVALGLLHVYMTAIFVLYETP